MNDEQKISNGPNARPRNESISSTAPGIPNDSSRPPEVDDEEVERVRAKLTGDSSKQDASPSGDQPGAAGERSAGAEEDTYD